MSNRELSEEWIGRTMFHLLRPQPPKCWYYCNTRLTKRKSTTRPDSHWVEEWEGMSKPARAKAIADWGAEKARRDEIRGRHGLPEEIPAAESQKYNCAMVDFLEKYQEKAPPAMPCVEIPYSVATATQNETNKVTNGTALAGEGSVSKETTKQQRAHQERWAPAGFQSEDFLAMIHLEIPPEKVPSISGAKAAVEKEWTKLFDMKTFDLERVTSLKDIQAMYKKANEPVHFGSLRTICHEKNAEMKKVIKEYKGRVVFRGDTVKNEDGYLAVFSEQGTASSHMAATKFLDAMGRMPDCEGEDPDAVGAYTQVSLDKETLKLLVGEGVFVDTWVCLPRNR